DRRRNLLSSEKRGESVGVGRKGKGTTALVLRDGDQTPLGVVIAPASEHEVRHIERLLDRAVVPLPDEYKLLYDGAAGQGGSEIGVAEFGEQGLGFPGVFP
ncbi:MAG: SMI1/KNR4 family protein, partial [Planctomycetaceae bacterium]|nr:SMI1/KNR4 family protein [Planctomycetaceae bacterium]